MNDNTIWKILICVTLGVLLSTGSQLQRDIARVNASLCRLEKHLGVSNPETDNIDEELKELISKGKKVKAIKRYRMATGIGLKEAKDYVDRLSESL